MKQQTRFHNWLQPVSAFMLAVALICAGCGRGGNAARTIIQNKGSDTMVNLAQSWAEAYSKVAPEVSVEVSGGGSGVGIAALSRGTIDIANSSRDIKPAEIEDPKRSTGREPKEFTAGYDALAIYVHKDNPVEEPGSQPHCRGGCAHHVHRRRLLQGRGTGRLVPLRVDRAVYGPIHAPLVC